MQITWMEYIMTRTNMKRNQKGCECSKVTELLPFHWLADRVICSLSLVIHSLSVEVRECRWQSEAQGFILRPLLCWPMLLCCRSCCLSVNPIKHLTCYLGLQHVNKNKWGIKPKNYWLKWFSIRCDVFILEYENMLRKIMTE